MGIVKVPQIPCIQVLFIKEFSYGSKKRKERHEECRVLIASLLLVLLTVTPSISDVYQDIGQIMYGWIMYGWINLARSNPMWVIETFGIDEARARQALGDKQWVRDTPVGLSQVP